MSDELKMWHSGGAKCPKCGVVEVHYRVVDAYGLQSLHKIVYISFGINYKNNEAHRFNLA